MAPPSRLLVVDDDPAASRMFERILIPWRSPTDVDALEQALFETPQPTSVPVPAWDVEMAPNGPEALAAVQRALAERRPFLAATVDLHMPIWDGYTTIRHLAEADEGLHLVVCTGDMAVRMDEIARSVRGAHRVHVLLKPFGPDDVLGLAARLVSLGR